MAFELDRANPKQRKVKPKRAAVVRPDVVVGYAKPKAKRASPAERRRLEQQVQREVRKARAGRGPRVDTGDVTRRATPAARRELIRNPPKQPEPAKKRPSFGRALRDELEGRGLLAEGAKKAAEAVGKHAVIVSTGGGPTVATRIGTGQSIRGKPKGRGVATALAPGSVKAPAGVSRTLKDLINFPAQAVPSVYVPAAAAREALPKAVGGRGDTSRGKKLLKDLPHTDPVAALVTGHPGRAAKLAEEHPGFAAIEAVGVKGTAGRGVTRAQELAGKRPTVHAPRQGPEGTGLAQPQRYSRDAGTRAIQKATERRRTRKAVELRKDPDRQIEAVRADPTRMSDAEIRKRVDERVAVNETIRRQNRAQAVEEAHRAVTQTATPTGSPRQRARTVARNRRTRVEPTAATTLHAQAITRASVDDLRTYRDELAAKHDELGPAQQQANRALRREIDKAIDKNPDSVKLQRAAEDWQAVMAPRQAKLVEHGLLSGEQAIKAPLVPYAVRHMEGVVPGEKGPVRLQRVTRTEPGKPVVRLVKTGEKTYKGKLPKRREFIAARAKADVADTPELAKLVENVKPGPPGISIQGEYVRERDRITREPMGFGREIPGSKVVVKRDTQGKPIGALHILLDENGKPTLLSVAVDPSQRGKGIASSLVQAAHDAGFDLSHAENAYTEAGAALKHKVLAKHGPPSLTVGRYAPTREPGKPVTVNTGIEHAPVSAAEIRSHMAERGVKPPAYVTQAPGQRGARNYFVSSGQPPRVTGGTRTGAATVHGTHEAHPDVLIEGVAKAQGLIDAAEGFGATVREFAHKPSLGKLKTKRDADNAARDLTAKTGTEWRAVRIQPFAGRSEQLKALLDKAGGEGGLDEHVGATQPVREALESAVRGDDGPGPWALMPEPAAAQFAQHLHQLGVGPKGKALQVVGSGFRRTVLATSPSWMTGNVTEATLRAGLAHAGPRSYMTGRRVVRALEAQDPQAARELAARALSGGHYSMADRTHIRRDSTQFKGSTVLEPLARGLGAFWRAPGPRHAAAAWKGWTDLVFRQLNGRLESQFQTAMLGKALRDSPLMDGHTLKISQAAVEQAARGLRDTNEQAALAREVERMYGKYQAFSPDTKWAISTYTPFIAWTINAVKFVTDVLPRDHPAVTAVIAASEQATEEWRKDKGLDLFMKGALPGFLQGSIPLSGGRHQRAPFRYTPFGAFGSPLESAGNAVLPQFSGVLAAFNGEDWKGTPLRKENGEPADELDKAKAAAASFIDATVPIVGLAKRTVQKGPSALNPIEPVKPKAKKTSGAATDSDIDFSTLDTTSIDTGDIDFSTLP